MVIQRKSSQTGPVGMTPKQKELMGFIRSYAEEHGYAPSQTEIASHFGFKSLGTVQNYLTRLQDQGVLEKSWNARRGIRIAENTEQPHAIRLPLFGRVAAGRPIEAIETHESIEVPSMMIRSSKTGRVATDSHFVLRIVGDSMIEDGILDGDYVVIRKQSTATNGQTVVALINNEATIKRFLQRENQIQLCPANPAYAPIVVPSESDFRIEGILAGVIRITQ